MSAEPARHLQPVAAEPELIVLDPSTGERRGTLDEHLQDLRDELAGAEKDIRAWRTRYANLKRDLDKEARGHELFPLAKRAFEHWQEVCRHPRSSFTPDRFRIVQPFLEDTERYGIAAVIRAIDGAAFDPYTTERKNGSIKRHDDWGLIFRNADKLEEFANRARPNWTMPFDPDNPEALPVGGADPEEGTDAK